MFNPEIKNLEARLNNRLDELEGKINRILELLVLGQNASVEGESTEEVENTATSFTGETGVFNYEKHLRKLRQKVFDYPIEKEEKADRVMKKLISKSVSKQKKEHNEKAYQQKYFRHL